MLDPAVVAKVVADGVAAGVVAEAITAGCAIVAHGGAGDELIPGFEALVERSPTGCCSGEANEAEGNERGVLHDGDAMSVYGICSVVVLWWMMMIALIQRKYSRLIHT